MTLRAPLYTKIEPVKRPPLDRANNLLVGTLKGQDKFFSAPGIGPSYSYPNPNGRGYAVALRSWSQNLLETTLRVTAVPFVPVDIQNPQCKAFPFTALSFGGAFIGTGGDQFFTDPGRGPSYDYPNPSGRVYPVSLRSWGDNPIATTLSIVQTKPFLQTDWPVPQGRKGSIELRTFINPIEVQLIGQDVFFGAAGQPPSNHDFQNPRGYTHPVALRFTANDLLQSTLAPVLASPFYQSDWPVPKGPKGSIDLRTFINPIEVQLIGQDKFFGAAGQPPPNTDFPNPRGYARAIDLRFTANDLLQSTLAPLVPKPFLQSEWPVPTTKKGSVSLYTWTGAVQVQLIGKDTFFTGAGRGPVYDYPNPRGKAYPLGLRTWQSQLPPGEIAVLPPTPPESTIELPRRRRTIIAATDRSTLVLRKNRTTLQ